MGLLANPRMHFTTEMKVTHALRNVQTMGGASLKDSLLTGKKTFSKQSKKKGVIKK